MSVIHTIPRDQHCPRCDVKLSKATAISGRTDGFRAGDISLCGCCGAILTFDEDLLIHLMTREQLERLNEVQRETLLRVRAFIKAMITRERRGGVRYRGLDA